MKPTHGHSLLRTLLALASLGAGVHCDGSSTHATTPDALVADAAGAPRDLVASPRDGAADPRNLDGSSDLGGGDACTAGMTRDCFVGDPALAGVGACKRGLQTCQMSGEFGSYGPCLGSGASSAEVCDGVDNDCNGHVDDGITRACYTGAAGTVGVGPCKEGRQTCQAGSFGACAGQVVPVAEICGNGIDDDCNGKVDDLCFSCPSQSATWQLPTGTTGGPACIRTGGGTCTGTLTCSGASCSTRGNCGMSHCGTLKCNDGTLTMTQYCDVIGTCSSSGVTLTGYTW